MYRLPYINREGWLKGFLKSGERRNENEKKIQAERPEPCFTPTPPTRPLYVGVGRGGGEVE